MLITVGYIFKRLEMFCKIKYYIPFEFRLIKIILDYFRYTSLNINKMITVLSTKLYKLIIKMVFASLALSGIIIIALPFLILIFLGYKYFTLY